MQYPNEFAFFEKINVFLVFTVQLTWSVLRPSGSSPSGGERLFHMRRGNAEDAGFPDKRKKHLAL